MRGGIMPASESSTPVFPVTGASEQYGRRFFGLPYFPILHFVVVSTLLN